MINKLARNIVVIIGLLCCLSVFILNIVYVSQIGDTTEEIVTTKKYGIFNIFITLFLIIGILAVSKKTEQIKISQKTQTAMFVIFIIIYSIAQILWINYRQATPAWDQGEVYKVAVNMYENKWDELKHYQYLEVCPQQITISAAFAGIFKIFSSTNVRILQYLNVAANVLTIIAMLLISKNIGKQYKVKKSILLILIGTFFTLPLLSTFVYGDLISLSMCLFAVYLIMRYNIEGKKRYAIISSLLMAIAYLLRMNNLIFIIAISIYLILNIFGKEENKKTMKEIITKILILAIFIIVAVLPATIVKNVLQNKLDLAKNKGIPTIGYLYMGMEESYRANGWYGESASWAWDDGEKSIGRYKEAIAQRTKYLIQNPLYTAKFYAKKIASMWTENTYASIWYNQTFNFKTDNDTEMQILEAQQKDERLQTKTGTLLIYQKAIVLIIFGASILVILKNRKNLSHEMIVLITIFIGGFLFHILWEAKSRYIIPYLLVLIPVASVSLDNWKKELIEMKEKIETIIKKVFTKEIMLYAIFGGLTTLLNLVVFWLLESVLNWNENISNFIAIVLSILFAYFTNRVWVFKSKVKGLKENFGEFARFISGRCLTMVLELVGGFLLFQTPIPTMISKLAITVIVIILNFFISKFFAFKTAKNGGEREA